MSLGFVKKVKALRFYVCLIDGGWKMSIKLLIDSCCDLPLAYVEDRSSLFQLVGMPINIDGEEQIDDLGKTFSHTYFYEKLRSGIMPKTSQINVMTFLDEYEKAYEEGNSLIYIGLSSGLSGTINNANLAKAMFLEDHEDAQIHVIDSLAASVGLGVLILHVVDLIQEDKTLEEVLKWIDEYRLYVNHWFAVDDLNHLKNGGRIPPAIAMVGTVLNVKPLLTMNREGKLESFATVRGRKKSIKYLESKFMENIGEPKTSHIVVAHSNCEEDAIAFKNELVKNNDFKSVTVSELSATIASHVGIGMIAVAFIGVKVREEK